MKFLSTPHLPKFTYGEHLRPTRDWLVMVLVGTLLLLLSATYSFFVFTQTKKIVSLNGESAPAVVATASSTDVTQIFKDRERERDNYMRVYRFVDPSR